MARVRMLGLKNLVLKKKSQKRRVAWFWGKMKTMKPKRGELWFEDETLKIAILWNNSSKI